MMLGQFNQAKGLAENIEKPLRDIEGILYRLKGLERHGEIQASDSSKRVALSHRSVQAKRSLADQNIS
jgi:hypothetical protein